MCKFLNVHIYLSDFQQLSVGELKPGKNNRLPSITLGVDKSSRSAGIIFPVINKDDSENKLKYKKMSLKFV